MQINIQVLIHW